VVTSQQVGDVAGAHTEVELRDLEHRLLVVADPDGGREPAAGRRHDLPEARGADPRLHVGPEGALLTDAGRVEDRIDAGSPRLRRDGTAVEEGEDDLEEALVPDTATLREQLPTEVDRLDGSVPVPQPLGDDEAGDGHVGEG